MAERFVLDAVQDDEACGLYHPAEPLRIFRCEVDPEDCELFVAKEHGLDELAPAIDDYLAWLDDGCEGAVSDYFSKLMGEQLPEGWFDEIEVYWVHLSFSASDDYGASIEFGESLLSDHIMAFHFDGREITGDETIG